MFSVWLWLLVILAHHDPSVLFSLLSDPPGQLCRSVVKLLYGDLDAHDVSLWGCEAVASLATGHKGNQAKLGQVGNYLADILAAHVAR